MKKAIQLITTLICFTLCGASAQAALYWDSNGTTDGGGTTPNGTWGTSAFWNATADGTATSPAAWVPGEDAVFSAGTDATGPFTVAINGTQMAGNLTVEEGTLTISGGTTLNVGGSVAGKGIIDIASGLTTTINTVLAGGDDTGQITKTGDGTLILNASCAHPGATTIAGGTLKLGASELLNNGSDLSFTTPTCVFDMNDFNQTIDGLSGFGTIYNGGTLTVGQNNKAAATFLGYLYDGSSPMTLIKVGTGTQTLAGTSYYTGPTFVSAGVLAVADGDALGTYDSPTVVSNGATLRISGGGVYGEPVILNGSGVANLGALRGSSANSTWVGGAQLGSDARINSGGADFFWNNYPIVGNNVNLTIGGDGGRVRLNQALNGNRAVQLGTGVFIKDGTSRLQLENPTICSEFHLNGGDVYPRNITSIGQGPIHVGGAANSFSALFQDCSLSQAISLAAGANLGFNCNQVQIPAPAAYDFTCNGVISGLGGVSKTNTGTLFLTKANTYSGDTTIQLGTLTLGASGSIANSAVIDVWSNATFNVSSNLSGFVLGAAQTLKGNGTVLGNVTANGALSPGASVGSLTHDGNLILAGILLIDVDKSLSPASANDLITVTGTLNHSGGGTVTVVNLGSALVVGDSFQVFNKAVAGAQTMTVAGGGATWTNKLAVDGSIAVVSVTPPPVIQVPRMTSVTGVTTPSVMVTWTNVMVGSNYWLQYNTNLNTTNWVDLSPVTASGSTASQVDGIPAGAWQRYYRVRFLTAGGTPPAAIPRITSVAFPGTIRVTVNYTNTVAGTNYAVQYRTNLNTTNWTSLSPVAASGPTSSTTDSFPAGNVQRYYRVYGQF